MRTASDRQKVPCVGTYHVAIIGAGVVGAMIARELSKYQLDVVILEKESDVAAQTSSANSGIVHAGYDAEPGSLKARLNVIGTKKMAVVAEELDVPYRNNGSLVLAFDAVELDKIQKLYAQGLENGVEHMQLLDGAGAREMEPAISSHVIGALYAPTAGIVCPYQLTVGAVENAVDNGVTLLRNWAVHRIHRLKDDALSAAEEVKSLRLSDKEEVHTGTTPVDKTKSPTEKDCVPSDSAPLGRSVPSDSAPLGRSVPSDSTPLGRSVPSDSATLGRSSSSLAEPVVANPIPRFLVQSDRENLLCETIINCAGLYADDVAAMVGDRYFRIHPRKGEYLLLDKQLGNTVSHVVFQAPGPMGKGILVTPTADGNLLLGPNAEEVSDKTDTETSTAGLQKVAEGARRSVPQVDPRAVIRSFAGLRAAADKGDFIIEQSPKVSGFYHVAGIESPGLSSAPAFGEEVVSLLKTALPLVPKENWQPLRRKRQHFQTMIEGDRAEAIHQNPSFGNIVCRCEFVTEAEIVDAVLRSAGARTLDGIKRRTRAGMGRCQGGFCTPRIVELLAKTLTTRIVELLAKTLAISPDSVTKSGVGSHILSGPSKPEICPVKSPEGLIERLDPHEVPVLSGKLTLPEKAALVVIGGGPAGLAAALEAKKTGISDVLILEREDGPGGILEQCIHPGFGVHLFGEELTGPEYAGRFIREAQTEGIRIFSQTTVLSLDADRTVRAVSPLYGLMSIKAGAVVLAMGCRERAAGALNIPGARPAGIMTAGSAQRFINMEGYLPGRKVVILGSGDIGLIMARRLTLEGAEVKMVCEILPYPGGLTRNIVQCLNDFDIPLLLSHTVIDLHGKERLTGVTIAKVDEQRHVIPGTEQRIDCDTLLLSVGLIPENELSRGAGILLEPVTGGPSVTMDMQTSLPGVFACGNVVHVHDLVDHVSEEGRLAGRSAARWLQAGSVAQTADSADAGELSALMATEPINAGELSALTATDTTSTENLLVQTAVIPVLAGEGIRYVLPKSVSLAGIQAESRLLFRVAAPARNVFLEVRSGQEVLIKVRKMRVSPGEMETISIKESWLKKVVLGNALSVHVVPTEAVDPLQRCKVMVLDMDGTFYLGNQLLESSKGFLDKLEATGRRFLFFTNNSSKSPNNYIEKLAAMGVAISKKQIMTSGDVAISYLQRERKDKEVFLLGTSALRQQFKEAGVRLVQPSDSWAPKAGDLRADIVMLAFDTELTYNHLSQACWHIRQGAEFLATHMDWNCPVEDGFIPDCGAMCALVEASTGVKPRFLGKPNKETLDAVMAHTGAKKEEIAFVGDRLYTDVATAVNHGTTGILVLTGETKKEDIAGSDIKPTMVFPSLKELGEALET